MHLFDSPTLQRQGSGTRLQTLYGLLATVLVLLTVGTSTGWAQAPTLATQAPSAVICAGNTATFDLVADAPDQIVYNVANVAYAGQNAAQANDITAEFGDETVYHLPAGDINAAVGGAFPFTFYGTTHDLSQEGLYIGSNGFLRFENFNPLDNIEANEFGINAQAIPNAAGPNDAIYFLNIDLFPQAGELITWDYDAVADAIVVTFTGVSQFNVNNPGVYPYQQVTVQVIIYSDNAGANAGQIDVNLEDWPDPIYIPNAHTIGVENNCGNGATAAGAPGAHNQTNWANADNGLAPPANGVAQTTWEFTLPGAPPVQTWSARLVMDGGNGIRETYDVNSIQGDDVFAGVLTGGDPIALTSFVLLTPDTYNFYAIVLYQNCYQAQTALLMSQVVVDPQPIAQTIQPLTANYCEGPTYNFSATPLNAFTTFAWTMPGLTNGVHYTLVQSGLQNQNAAFTFIPGSFIGSQAGTNRTIRATETGPGPEFCSMMNDKLIAVFTTPAGTISTGSPYCAANTGSVTYNDFATFSGTATTYAWSITNPGTTGANIVNPTQASPELNIGTYLQASLPQLVTLNLTATNGPAGLCSFTTSTTFTVNPGITAKTITPSPTTFCTNQAITFSLTGVAGNEYQWLFTGAGAYSGPDAAYPGAFVLNKTSVQITYSGAGASTITANERTPQGCVLAHTLIIAVSATPAPTITGSNVPCQFLASLAGPPAVQTNPTPQQYVYTVAVPSGTNGYRWTVTNGGVIVAVNGVPGTYANPYPSVSTFQTGASNITVRWPITGAATVTVSEQGPAPNSCVGTFSYPVTVNASPTGPDFDIIGPGLIGGTPPCQFQATTATAYSVTAVGGGQHNIQLNGGTAAAAAPYLISVGGTVISGTGPGTFGSVTWTSLTPTIVDDYSFVPSGCTSRETYNVVVQPLPSATITGPTDVCGNSIPSYSASNPQNTTSYQWGWANDLAGTAFPAGTAGGVIATPLVQTTNVTFGNVGGTFFLGVRLTGPAPSNCQQLFVMGITVTPQPSTPVFGAFVPITVCDSTSFVYTVTGTLGNDIRLNVVGGRFTAPSAGTSIAFPATGAAQNFTVEWINSFNGGTGFVTATQYTTGVPSCTSAVATSPTITIIRQPNTTVVGPSPVCGNDQNVVYTASNPQFINTYLWGWANDAIGTGFPGGPAAGPFDGAIVNPSVTVDMANVAGTYFLTVEVINTTGFANCRKIFTKTIVLNAQPATPVIVNNRVFPICDSTNSAVPDYEITVVANPLDTVVITVTGGYFPWSSLVPGNPPNSSVVRVPAGSVPPGSDLPVFWAMGGGGGVGTISAYIVTNTIPQCSSLVGTMAPSQVVDPLPAYPTVAITPDPPGYCTDAVPVNFNLFNTGAYPGAPNQYTVVWTWPSPAGGTTPGGFAGAPNDPVVNEFVNEQYVVTNWTATPFVGFTTTFNISITNGVTGCSRDNDYTVVVQPRPNPIISGPITACQEPTDPVGAAAGTTFVNPRYTYSTPQVAGNYYNWSITDGYIVAYSVTGPGGPWIQTVATSTMPGGSPILNASAVQVVFYGPTPGSVKVAEITAPTSPPGCQTTTADYAVTLDPLTPWILIDLNSPSGVCFNDPILVDQDDSDIGHTYQLQISTNGGATFANVTAATPTPSQAGTGAGLSWTVPTGLGTQAVAPGFYDFRSVATSPAGCLSYTGDVTIEVVPNPDTIPMSPLTDTICDTSPGIPFTVGPTVQDFVFYTLEREGPVGVWTSEDTFFYFGGAPATDVLTDISNPPGAAAPAGIVYNYRVVAVALFTNCSTILDTSVITVVDPCVPVIGAVNTPPGYNLDEVCIYGGFEEHLVTYQLAPTPCFTNTPGATLNWYTSAPPGSLVTGAVREQGGDTAVVEWYTTGGTQFGIVNVDLTLPAAFGGCVSSAAMQVRVYPLPVPNIHTGPAQVCQNQQDVQYTATLEAGDTYMWQVVGGLIDQPVGATGAGTTLSPSTYTAVNANVIRIDWLDQANPSATITLTQTTPVGCLNRTTRTIVVNPTPTPSINGPAAPCGLEVVTYTTQNNAPNNSYQWSIQSGPGTIQSGATTNSIQFLTGAAGTSTVLRVAETILATGCSKNNDFTINPVLKPTPVITRTSPLPGNVGNACLTTAMVYSTASVVGNSRLWTIVGGSISGLNSGTSVNVTWNVLGNQSLTVAEWVNASQCTTTVTQQVVVEAIPSPSITGPVLVCGSTSSNYSTPLVAGHTYVWSLTNAAHGAFVGSTTSNSSTILWNNPAPGATFVAQVNVVETATLAGCSNSALLGVTVHRQPTVPVITRTSPAGNANQACTSDNITYSVTNNAGSTFLWNVTGGNIQSGQGTSSVVVEWTAAGNGTVTLTETTTANTACFATGTLNVTVEQKPTPTVTGPTLVCGSTTQTYSTPAVLGDTYLWTIGNAAHGTITSSATTNSINVLWNNPTPGSTFSALLTVVETTGTGNCTGTANATVVIHRQPTVPVITRTSPAGNANQACTSDNITYSVTNNAGSTYLWNVTGGNIQSGQGTSSTVIEWTAAGNGTVTLTETTTGNTACFATATLNVTVEDKPAPTVTGPTVVCGNAISTYSTPAVAGTTYQWTIANAAHGTITSSATTNSINVTWNNPVAGSTFTATVTVVQTTLSGNCTGTANATVIVHRQPTVPVITRTSPAGNANQACTSDNITYSVTNNAGSTYLWNVTGGNIQSGQGTSSVVIEWTVAGTNTVTLTETTTANTLCTAMATLNVAVENKPTPTVTGPAVVCGNATSNYSSPAVAGDTYLWSIGNAAHGTITSSTTTNAITIMWNNPAPATTFAATVTVVQTTPSGNCTGTANISVTVHRQPTVPVITRTSPAGNVAQACTSDNITYSVTNNAGSTYTWAVTGGNIVSGQSTSSVVIQWTVAGNNTLTVTETTTGNTACTAMATQNVAVEADPVPTITGPAVVCGNQTATYSTPAVAGNTYAWTIGNAAHGTITSSTTTN
ncbi:MAG: hypothetical protein SGJ05_04820, partial [bacterium]|nr:hypothetical protein [bacterium]